MVALAREQLKCIFKKSAYSFESGDLVPGSAITPITEILIDMSRYESDELVQGSLHLLSRLFSSETSLFHSAMQTVLLLTEKSKNVRIIIIFVYLCYKCFLSFAGFSANRKAASHFTSTIECRTGRSLQD